MYEVAIIRTSDNDFHSSVDEAERCVCGKVNRDHDQVDLILLEVRDFP